MDPALVSQSGRLLVLKGHPSLISHVGASVGTPSSRKPNQMGLGKRGEAGSPLLWQPKHTLLKLYLFEMSLSYSIILYKTSLRLKTCFFQQSLSQAWPSLRKRQEYMLSIQSLAHQLQIFKSSYQTPFNYLSKLLLGSWNKDQLHSKWVTARERSLATFLA